jgi:amino acid adenylation domain-containing protein
MQSEFKITNKDVFLQKTSYTFDISTYELLLPLQSGARIVILPEEKEIDIFLLHDIIDKEKVSIINFTPSMLKIFSSMNLNEKLDSLRLVLISGEALKQKIVNEAIEYLPDCELYNVYGLTEIQSVTAYKCNGSDTANIVSLGRPIPDTTLYVLDESQKRVPVGHPGELYVSGATLANGYLNNPDLTEQKFLTNPFSDDKISLIYRTGDRVRCLEDGSLEYIGRLDDQVKIRGYRVELGEIENLLSKHDLVKDIAILCADKFSEERSLAAYVVPNLERALQLHVEAHRITEILREYTASKLPHYMVPTFFTLIEALPLNKNGKIDRSHLINLLSK